jgi:hypothetical protein
MERQHSWLDCRPALVATGDDRTNDSEMAKAVQRSFDRLNSAERMKWHQFMCHNRHTPENRAVVAAMFVQIRAERGLYGLEQLKIEFDLDDLVMSTQGVPVIPSCLERPQDVKSPESSQEVARYHCAECGRECRPCQPPGPEARLLCLPCLRWALLHQE